MAIVTKCEPQVISIAPVRVTSLQYSYAYHGNCMNDMLTMTWGRHYVWGQDCLCWTDFCPLSWGSAIDLSLSYTVILSIESRGQDLETFGVRKIMLTSALQARKFTVMSANLSMRPMNQVFLLRRAAPRYWNLHHERTASHSIAAKARVTRVAKHQSLHRSGKSCTSV